jgi:dTDP-4-dehydrorhamnose reductase
MMDVLILGKGYIGTALYKNLSQKTELNVRIVSKLDLQYDDPKVFEETINQQSNLIVINASGYTGRPNVDACETDRDRVWYYNVTVPGMIGDTCRRHGVYNIHISSGCIYDGYSREFTECDEPNFGLREDHSSWYSKTKHAGELTLSGTNTHIFRIRMPFCSTTSGRNIIMKLLNYDYIINEKNSVTNIEDLSEFTSKFIMDSGALYDSDGGVYNVVNPSPVSTSKIIDTLVAHGVENPKWQYITLDELYDRFTTTGRSNCVLSSDYIKSLGLELPETELSLTRCINILKNELHEENI